MENKLLTILAVGLLAGPMAAQSFPIERTFEITATDFTHSSGSSIPPPVDPFMIDFSVRWDPNFSYSATTEGLTINSFNLPYAAQFSYIRDSGIMVLATYVNENGCANGPESFCLIIRLATFQSPGPFVSFLDQYTESGDWISTNKAIISGPIIYDKSVPEPSVLSLLSIGLAGLGFTRRRMKV
jgi:PEP-CTERM motif